MLLKIVVELLAMCALALCGQTRSKNRQPKELDDSVSKISGGRNARQGEFPFMAHLFIIMDKSPGETQKEMECGGVIISDRRVLTACHCLADPRKAVADDCVKLRDPTNSYVTAGSVDRNDTRRTQIRYARSFQIHRKCKSNDLEIIVYDLGIVTVAQKFQFNIDVQIARVPISNKTDYRKQIENVTNRGTLCELIGWGYSIEDTGGAPTRILQTTTTHIISKKDCETLTCRQMTNKGTCAFRSIETIFCGTFQNDACFSDSGGPLLCDGHLVALISDSMLCSKDSPTLYISLEDVLELFQVEEVTSYRQRSANNASSSPLTIKFLILISPFYTGFLTVLP